MVLQFQADYSPFFVGFAEFYHYVLWCFCGLRNILLGYRALLQFLCSLRESFVRTPINLFNLTLETISNSRGSQQSCQIFYKVHHHALLQDVFILFVEQWSEQFCKSEYKDDVFTVIREKIWLKMVDSNYQLYQLLASAIQLHWKRISGVFKVNWNILWYWETHIHRIRMENDSDERWKSCTLPRMGYGW